MTTLQEMALALINDVNPEGLFLKDCLWAMPAHVRMVVFHGVRHGAALALVAAQLHSSHDLRLLEPGFPVGANKHGQEKLISDFTTATEAIVAIPHAGNVVLDAFFGP